MIGRVAVDRGWSGNREVVAVVWFVALLVWHELGQSAVSRRKVFAFAGLCSRGSGQLVSLQKGEQAWRDSGVSYCTIGQRGSRLAMTAGGRLSVVTGPHCATKGATRLVLQHA